MKSRITSFSGELSSQNGLSGHLALRALDAFESGDSDAFRYASEIHDETQTRIHEIGAARVSMRSAIETYREDGLIERPIGAAALAAMVLNRELKIA
jgi:hypothetical protein